MKYIRHIIIGLSIIAGFAVVVVVPDAVSAVNVIDDTCAIDPNSAICNSSGDSAENVVANVVNTLLLVLGFAAVIVVIIGGIMYAVSAGEAAQVAKAKNTILYAVIGMVIAFSAYAIVSWVVTRF